MILNLALSGAAGRMGRRVIALASRDAALRVVAALESGDNPHLGADAGVLAGVDPIGVPVADRIDAAFDVMIDFSSPAGTERCLETCRRLRRALVIGATGHSDDQLAEIRVAAMEIPILKSANMSLGVNLLLRMVRGLAAALDDSYDVEIVEAHHRFKKDAPSGTANALRDAIQAGRADAGRAPGGVSLGRSPDSPPRAPGEIGMHALRLGDVVGAHEVHFAALGETLTLAHAARDRDIFAAGALRAAQWLAGRPPGLYDMLAML